MIFNFALWHKACDCLVDNTCVPLSFPVFKLHLIYLKGWNILNYNSAVLLRKAVKHNEQGVLLPSYNCYSPVLKSWYPPISGNGFNLGCNTLNSNQAMAGAVEGYGIPAHYNSIFPDTLLVPGMCLPVLDIVLSCWVPLPQAQHLDWLWNTVAQPIKWNLSPATLATSDNGHWQMLKENPDKFNQLGKWSLSRANGSGPSHRAFCVARGVSGLCQTCKHGTLHMDVWACAQCLTPIYCHFSSADFC